jgi:hypothetical protein
MKEVLTPAIKLLYKVNSTANQIEVPATKLIKTKPPVGSGQRVLPEPAGGIDE